MLRRPTPGPAPATPTPATPTPATPTRAATAPTATATATATTSELTPGCIVWATVDRGTMVAAPGWGRGTEVVQVASVRRLDWVTSLVCFTVGAQAEVAPATRWVLA